MTPLHLTLEETPESLLARSAVFRGGFTLEAAQTIVATNEAERALFRRLVEDGVFTSDSTGRLTFDGEVGDLADDDPCCLRHESYFHQHAESWTKEARTRAGAQSLAHLEVEHANILRAADTARARGEGTLSAQLLLTLAPLVTAESVASCSTRAADIAERVTHALDAPILIEHRIRLLSMRARCNKRLGHRSLSLADLEEARTLAQRAGFRREEARLFGELAMLAVVEGDFRTALSRAREAFDLQGALGDGSEQAISQTELAMIQRELGALREAQGFALRALATHRSSGNALHEAATLLELVFIAAEIGAYHEARASLLAAAILADEVGTRALGPAVAFARAVIEHGCAANGVLAAEEASASSVEALYGEAIRAAGEHSRIEGLSFAQLGVLAFDRGDLQSAEERLAFGAALLAHVNDQRRAGLATAYRGAAAWLANDVPNASALFAEARTLVAETDPLHVTIGIIEATLTGGPLPLFARESAKVSWDARLALHRYERTVGVVSSPDESVERCTYRVASDGTWIEHEDGRRISCQTRLATQRLLAALARARNETPGRTIPLSDLIAVGWPGERLQEAAGKNRLRVALSWMRKNGLGRALASAANGYLLNPRLVDVVPSGESSRASLAS